MSLLSKFRVVQGRDSSVRPAVNQDPRVPVQPLHAPTVSRGTASAPSAGRFSNGLKEFLWQLHDVHRGNLLDVGAVSQTTLNFFIALGFRVYTEDLLSGWNTFYRAEDELIRTLPAGAEAPDSSSAARAQRFLNSSLGHPPETFDAILLWDLLDYLGRDAGFAVAAKLSTLVRENGAILAVFHTRMPEQFQRYRVLDGCNLEFVAAPPILQPQHVYQNREVQNLFTGFRSSKMFVARDQLREGVFIK